MKDRFEWLDRGLVYGPYFTLCLYEKDFRAALAHCKVTEAVHFLKTSHSDATTHFMSNPKGERVAIVCMGGWEKQTGIKVAGLLVHEAVHIFQEWCNTKGEDYPSSEFEAYSIQWISQQLMWEFQRQTKRKGPRRAP